MIDVSAAPHQGWGMLKAIKGHPQTQGVPVLFCSLSQDGGSVLEFDYLTKPIEVADLARALDQHWLAPDADRDFKTIGASSSPSPLLTLMRTKKEMRWVYFISVEIWFVVGDLSP